MKKFTCHLVQRHSYIHGVDCAYVEAVIPDGHMFDSNNITGRHENYSKVGLEQKH
jgi:hypothetical protein